MKKMIGLFSIAIVFVMWFAFGDSEEGNDRKVSAITDAYSSAAVSSVPLAIMNAESALPSAILASQAAAYSSTKSQVKPYDGWDDRLPEDYKNWQRSRGTFSEVDLQEYKRLRLDELEILANKGDLKAIEVLAQYELAAGNSKRYRELVELSVVSGSLSGVTSLSVRKLGDYIISGRKNEADILEGYALQTFAFHRGNLDANYQQVAKTYNFYPNEEQELFIDQRADELMIEYEEKRKVMGLPPFDNSPLASEKEIYDQSAEFRAQSEMEYRQRERAYRAQQEADGK